MLSLQDISYIAKERIHAWCLSRNTLETMVVSDALKLKAEKIYYTCLSLEKIKKTSKIHAKTLSDIMLCAAVYLHFVNVLPHLPSEVDIERRPIHCRDYQLICEGKMIMHPSVEIEYYTDASMTDDMYLCLLGCHLYNTIRRDLRSACNKYTDLFLEIVHEEILYGEHGITLEALASEPLNDTEELGFLEDETGLAYHNTICLLQYFRNYVLTDYPGNEKEKRECAYYLYTITYDVICRFQHQNLGKAFTLKDHFLLSLASLLVVAANIFDEFSDNIYLRTFRLFELHQYQSVLFISDIPDLFSYGVNYVFHMLIPKWQLDILQTGGIRLWILQDDLFLSEE